MNSEISPFHENALKDFSFVQCECIDKFNSMGTCYKLSSKVGEGYFWIYTHPDLFHIKIHDFFFHDDAFLTFDLPKSLTITKYDSISGEELIPYRRMTANCVKTFIGGFEPYKLLIHKKIPIKSIDIQVEPNYYLSYLKKQYPEDYENPFEAFKRIDEVSSFPAVAKLLYQIQQYRNEGFSAKLFYEGKVAEIVSTVIEYQHKQPKVTLKRISEQDEKMIDTVIKYLNDHFAYEIPLERLAKIACMGTTKLKYTFKQIQNCTITEYTQHKRMSQAEHLLSNTDLTIGQVAATVGYKSASRFSELFHKSTGMLPKEYRDCINE